MLNVIPLTNSRIGNGAKFVCDLKKKEKKHVYDLIFILCSVTLSGLGNREYGRTDPSRSPRGTIYPQKSALTSPTSGGRSVGIIRSRTQATELLL
jgi:hypothetical protein